MRGVRALFVGRLVPMRRQVGGHQSVYVRHHAERSFLNAHIRVEELDAELVRVELLQMFLDWGNQI